MLNLPILKAFVLCDDVSENLDSAGKKDLRGVGVSRIACDGPFPVKLSFWTFIQLTGRNATGVVRLSLMRADSGRRFLFRAVTVHHKNALEATAFCIRLHECVFPDKGVYFLELWYDKNWLIDQRVEIV